MSIMNKPLILLPKELILDRYCCGDPTWFEQSLKYWPYPEFEDEKEAEDMINGFREQFPEDGVIQEPGWDVFWGTYLNLDTVDKYIWFYSYLSEYDRSYVEPSHFGE